MQNNNETNLLIKQGLLTNSSTPSLNTFITRLDNGVEALSLKIINNPKYLTDNKRLLEAQKETGEQMEIMQKWGLLCQSTHGLMHFFPDEDSQSFRVLTSEEVSTYYTKYAKLILERKKCTCDGLVAVAFYLAKQILQNQTNWKITIDLCSLSNWSHAFIRISRRKSDGGIESLFYDPWYQRCVAKFANEPKTFSEKQLNLEMTKLINLVGQSNLIQATQILSSFEYDGTTVTLAALKQGGQVNNKERDFAYFIACSTESFTNPSQRVPDPSEIVPTNNANWRFCNVV